MSTARLGWLNVASWVLLAGAMLMLFLVAWLLYGLAGVVVAGAAILMVGLARQPPADAEIRAMGGYMPRGRAGEVLRRACSEIGRRARLSAPPRLWILPGSGFEAFSTGDREAGTIVLSEAVLARLTPRQVRAVLGHEIAHLAAEDSAAMRLATGMTQIAYLIIHLALFAMLLWTGLFGVQPPATGVLILLSAVPTAMVLLQLWVSRLREYAADEAAAEMTDDPLALASALQRLDTLSRSRWLPTAGAAAPVPVALRTHPPTHERVRRLSALAREGAKRSVAPGRRSVVPIRIEGGAP